jgi:hypothetical protein
VEKIRVEVEVEDRQDTKVIEVEGGSLDAILGKIRRLAELEETHDIFERDGNEPVGPEIEKKKHIALVAHRCKHVLVKVRYEHRTIEHHYRPSATVFRVLQWAIGKKGFNLDDTAKAKANLMLPDATEPLPKNDVIGRFVKHGHCELTLDLTLKDFTNG